MALTTSELTVGDIGNLQAIMGARALQFDDFCEAFSGAVGASVDREMLRLTFDLVDSNEDGAVTFKEFQEHVQQVRRAEANELAWLANKESFREHAVTGPAMPRHLHHPASIKRIITHPRSGALITCGLDGSVRAWDPVSLEYERTVHFSTYGLADADYDLQTDTLAVATCDQVVSLYHLQSGRLLRSLRAGRPSRAALGIEDEVYRPQFRTPKPTPEFTFRGRRAPELDGSTLQKFWFSRNSMLLQRVWAHKKHIERHSATMLPGTVENVTSLCCSLLPGADGCGGSAPDSIGIFLSTSKGSVDVYEVSTGPSRPGHAGESVGGEGGQWGANTLTKQDKKRNDLLPIAQWQPHRAAITRIRRESGTDNIITASMDSDIQVLNIERGIVLKTFKGTAIETMRSHTRGVLGFERCDHPKLLGSWGHERYAILWDPLVAKPLQTLHGHVACLVDLKFSPTDSNMVFTYSEDRTVRIWDLRTFRCMQQIRERPWETLGRPGAIHFDHKRNAIITATQRLYKKEAVRAQFHEDYYGHTQPVVHVAYCAEQNVVCSCDEVSLRVWDAATRRLSIMWPLQPIHGICLDARGFEILIDAGPGDLQVISTNSGQPILVLTGTKGPTTTTTTAQVEDAMGGNASVPQLRTAAGQVDPRYVYWDAGFWIISTAADLLFYEDHCDQKLVLYPLPTFSRSLRSLPAAVTALAVCDRRLLIGLQNGDMASIPLRYLQHRSEEPILKFARSEVAPGRKHSAARRTEDDDDDFTDLHSIGADLMSLLPGPLHHDVRPMIKNAVRRGNFREAMSTSRPGLRASVSDLEDVVAAQLNSAADPCGSPSPSAASRPITDLSGFMHRVESIVALSSDLAVSSNGLGVLTLWDIANSREVIRWLVTLAPKIGVSALDTTADCSDILYGDDMGYVGVFEVSELLQMVVPRPELRAAQSKEPCSTATTSASEWLPQNLAPKIRRKSLFRVDDAPVSSVRWIQHQGLLCVGTAASKLILVTLEGDCVALLGVPVASAMPNAPHTSQYKTLMRMFRQEFVMQALGNETRERSQLISTVLEKAAYLFDNAAAVDQTIDEMCPVDPERDLERLLDRAVTSGKENLTSLREKEGLVATSDLKPKDALREAHRRTDTIGELTRPDSMAVTGLMAAHWESEDGALFHPRKAKPFRRNLVTHEQLLKELGELVPVDLPHLGTTAAGGCQVEPSTQPHVVSPAPTGPAVCLHAPHHDASTGAESATRPGCVGEDAAGIKHINRRRTSLTAGKLSAAISIARGSSDAAAPSGSVHRPDLIVSDVSRPGGRHNLKRDFGNSCTSAHTAAMNRGPQEQSAPTAVDCRSEQSAVASITSVEHQHRAGILRYEAGRWQHLLAAEGRDRTYFAAVAERAQLLQYYFCPLRGAGFLPFAGQRASPAASANAGRSRSDFNGTDGREQRRAASAAGSGTRQRCPKLMQRQQRRRWLSQGSAPRAPATVAQPWRRAVEPQTPLGSRWFDAWCDALELPVISEGTRRDKESRVRSLTALFADRCVELVRVLLSCSSGSDPPTQVGPFLWTSDDISIQQVTNPVNARICGSMEAATKLASREVQGASAFLTAQERCTIRMHVPLVCVVRHLGHCFFCASVIPAVPATEEVPLTPAYSWGVLGEAHRQAFSSLNLRGSLRQVDVPQGFRRFRLCNGRIVAVGFGRLFPLQRHTSTTTGTSSKRGDHLVLRPELVATASAALSSNSYDESLSLTDRQDADQGAIKATRRLEAIISSEIVPHLVATDSSVCRLTDGRITDVLHAAGVNLRLMGRVAWMVDAQSRQAVAAPASTRRRKPAARGGAVRLGIPSDRSGVLSSRWCVDDDRGDVPTNAPEGTNAATHARLLLEEMVARAARNILFSQWRSYPSCDEQAAARIAADFAHRLTSGTPDSRKFWAEELSATINELFPHVTQRSIAPSDVELSRVVERLSSLCGISVNLFSGTLGTVNPCCKSISYAHPPVSHEAEVQQQRRHHRAIARCVRTLDATPRSPDTLPDLISIFNSAAAAAAAALADTGSCGIDNELRLCTERFFGPSCMLVKTMSVLRAVGCIKQTRFHEALQRLDEASTALPTDALQVRMLVYRLQIDVFAHLGVSHEWRRVAALATELSRAGADSAAVTLWGVEDMGRDLERDADARLAFGDIEARRVARDLAVERFRIARRVFARDYQEFPVLMKRIANCHVRLEEEAEAIEIHQSLLAFCENWFGRNSPQCASVYEDMGELAVQLRNWPMATHHFQQASVIRERAHGPQAPPVAIPHILSAAAALELGKFDLAQAALRTASHYLTGVRFDNPILEQKHIQEARLHAHYRSFDRAIECWTKVLDARERTIGPMHPLTTAALFELATLFFKGRKYHEAWHAFDVCRQSRSKKLGARHHSIAHCLTWQSRCERALGDEVAAVQTLRQAIRMFESTTGESIAFPLLRAQAMIDIAEQLIDDVTGLSRPDPAAVDPLRLRELGLDADAEINQAEAALHTAHNLVIGQVEDPHHPAVQLIARMMRHCRDLRSQQSQQRKSTEAAAERMKLLQAWDALTEEAAKREDPLWYRKAHKVSKLRWNVSNNT